MSAVAGPCASARSSVGNAIVEDHAGTPCFRIEDHSWWFESKFKLNSISVVDKTLTRATWDAPYVAHWGVDVTPGQKPLKVTRDDCLSDGVLPPSMVQRAAPKVLELSKVYAVSISANEIGGSVSTSGDHELFCLVRARDGTLEVRSADADNSGEELIGQVCQGTTRSR